MSITNPGPRPINGWTLRFQLGRVTVVREYSARVSISGETVTARHADNNATIPAGKSVSFGFGGRGRPGTPSNCVLNGQACRFS